jgi:hypothetical protein
MIHSSMAYSGRRQPVPILILTLMQEISASHTLPDPASPIVNILGKNSAFLSALFWQWLTIVAVAVRLLLLHRPVEHFMELDYSKGKILRFP